MPRSATLIPLLVGVSFASLFASSGLAARLVRVEIRLDGKTVLQTAYQDNGRADRAAVWRYLGEEPIFVEAESLAITSDVPGGAVATLKGDILVTAGSAVLRTDSLILYRKDTADNLWMLLPSEVERTALMQGFGPPQTVGFDWRMILMLAAFLICVLTAIALVIAVISLRGKKFVDAPA